MNFFDGVVNIAQQTAILMNHGKYKIDGVTAFIMLMFAFQLLIMN